MSKGGRLNMNGKQYGLAVAVTPVKGSFDVTRGERHGLRGRLPTSKRSSELTSWLPYMTTIERG